MTKRYKKFEEWMIGERVHWDGGFEQSSDSGVVVGMYHGMVDTVYVKWDSDWGKAWLNVDKVTFEKDNKVEEQNTEQEIKWEVGQVIWDLIDGRGVVNDVTNGHNPIGIKFDNGKSTYAYKDGSRLVAEGKRTIFFSEPKIEAEPFPPKKPFVPKMKFDDLVVVINKETAKVGFYGHVEHEFEGCVAMRTGGVYEKAYYSFFKLGEEIKFEEN